MKQFLILYTSVMLLTGCAGTATKRLISVAEGEKAAVFSTCNVKPSFIPCSTTWINQQTQEKVVFKVGKSGGINIIEPGTYSLYGFHAQHYYNGTTHSISDLANIAHFSVKKGEVLYIGTIEFDLRKNFSIHHAIAVFDDKNGASQYLSEHQPELLPRLQTKLIQLSPEVTTAKTQLPAQAATAQKYLGL